MKQNLGYHSRGENPNPNEQKQKQQRYCWWQQQQHRQSTREQKQGTAVSDPAATKGNQRSSAHPNRNSRMGLPAAFLSQFIYSTVAAAATSARAAQSQKTVPMPSCPLIRPLQGHVQQGPSWLIDLPPELMLKLAQHLTIRSLFHLSLTCRRARNIFLLELYRHHITHNNGNILTTHALKFALHNHQIGTINWLTAAYYRLNIPNQLSLNVILQGGPSPEGNNAALVCAATSRDAIFTDYLLAHGVDVNLGNPLGHVLKGAVGSKGRACPLAMVRLFAKRRARLDAAVCETHAGIRDCQLEMAQSCFERGPRGLLADDARGLLGLIRRQGEEDLAVTLEIVYGDENPGFEMLGLAVVSRPCVRKG
ncbi:hypothetical protein B0T17DRAFT_603063 [Bombardia bombarda]|uniref:F-box domain-containing protein n=1 Tax=Bombardia bombarda TaxID=252184 RepID=A0AA39U3T5_9PEZI|nr:hypothetical protein B0T17DRAFT_603063 [Bombardia bombarda]